MAGARAYAEVARLVPRSGGEYRYLSELLHPSVGYLAGWGSLLVGFSAPIAVDALAAGDFVQRLLPGVDAKWLGAGLIGLLTLVHAIGLRTSTWVQNSLVAVKVALVAGFAGIGLLGGHNAWPTWHPPGQVADFRVEPFAASLFYIAFAFSGWNAATYAAEEFQDPKRDVPRAMLIGCGLVGVLYGLVNWVFVANLTPTQASAVFQYDAQRVTLGHVLAQQWVGDAGARVMSAVIAALFVSAISAMTFVGPRVYAAMAKDGFLPQVFAGTQGRPPTASVILQGALAIVIVLTHGLQQVLQNMGAILSLFAALTVASLFKVRFGKSNRPRPPLISLLSAGLYALLTAWMLFFAFRTELSCYLVNSAAPACATQPHLLLWIVSVAGVALAAFAVTRARQAR